MATAEDLFLGVGDPEEKWEALKDRIQLSNVTRFADVEREWLDLMWTLDAYRTAGIPPTGMAAHLPDIRTRMGVVNRAKGNWFATLVTLLLENQTRRRLAPRVKVEGFSQVHQIDVGWPDRKVDPLICLETKVTGAAPSPNETERAATADWTNRRKELKFASVDLKLARWQGDTAIAHWDVWRASAYPKCFFVWAARVTNKDRIENMVREVQVLARTYLEAAGVYAWRAEGESYVPVAFPPASRVSTVDDVLHRITAEILAIAPAGHEPPAPVGLKDRLDVADL